MSLRSSLSALSLVVSLIVSASAVYRFRALRAGTHARPESEAGQEIMKRVDALTALFATMAIEVSTIHEQLVTPVSSGGMIGETGRGAVKPMLDLQRRLVHLEEAMTLDCRLVLSGSSSLANELYTTFYHLGILERSRNVSERSASFLGLAYMDEGPKLMVGLEHHWVRDALAATEPVDQLSLVIAASRLTRHATVRGILLDFAKNSRFDRIRSESLAALAQYEDEQVWLAVREALRDPAEMVRQRAADMLMERR